MLTKTDIYYFLYYSFTSTRDFTHCINKLDLHITYTVKLLLLLSYQRRFKRPKFIIDKYINLATFQQNM